MEIDILGIDLAEQSSSFIVPGVVGRQCIARKIGRDALVAAFVG
ncbi:hypothetical protein ACT2FY_40895 [Paraburkholderia fungorum]